MVAFFLLSCTLWRFVYGTHGYFYIVKPGCMVYLFPFRPRIELLDERSQRETSGICGSEGDPQHLLSVQRSHGSAFSGSVGHCSLPWLLRPVHWGSRRLAERYFTPVLHLCWCHSCASVTRSVLLPWSHMFPSLPCPFRGLTVGLKFIFSQHVELADKDTNMRCMFVHKHGQTIVLSVCLFLSCLSQLSLS